VYEGSQGTDQSRKCKAKEHPFAHALDAVKTAPEMAPAKKEPRWHGRFGSDKNNSRVCKQFSFSLPFLLFADKDQHEAHAVYHRLTD